MNAMLKPITPDKGLPTVTRAPRGHMGFSWGRFPLANDAGVEYRLFRRDLTGRLYIAKRQFQPEQLRDQAARHLWQARIALRERVDEIVLAQLGLREEVGADG